jgi:hypothetical protein
MLIPACWHRVVVGSLASRQLLVSLIMVVLATALSRLSAAMQTPQPQGEAFEEARHYGKIPTKIPILLNCTVLCTLLKLAA